MSAQQESTLKTQVTVKSYLDINANSMVYIEGFVNIYQHKILCADDLLFNLCQCCFTSYGNHDFGCDGSIHTGLI